MELNPNSPKKRNFSDIEIVVISTKELEERLVNELFAPKFRADRTPTSFSDKQKHVEYLFGIDDVEKFKYISNVRNILVHKVNENRINDRRRFELAVSDLNMAIDIAKIKSQNQRITANNQNRQTPKSSSPCYIATAAYGSPYAKEVDTFRYFRDTVLAKSWFGRAFIAFYYKTSPPLADFIAEREYLKVATRKWLLAPLLHFLRKK